MLKINLPLFAEGYLKDELTHLKPCGGEDSPERCDSDIPCPIWTFCVCDSNCFTPTSTLIFRDSFPCSGSVQSPLEGSGENKRQKFPTQTKCPCSAPKPHQRQIKRLPKKRENTLGSEIKQGWKFLLWPPVRALPATFPLLCFSHFTVIFVFPEGAQWSSSNTGMAKIPHQEEAYRQ